MYTLPSISPITRSVPCLLFVRSPPSPGQCAVYSSFTPIAWSVRCLLLLCPHNQVSALSAPSARHQVSVICTHLSPPSPGQCRMYSSFSPITRSVSYLLLRSRRLVSAICTPNSPPSPGQCHIYSSFAPIDW